MSKDKVCLYCINWQQFSNDRAVGKCSVHNGYRLQYEDCPRWRKGGVRIPYRDQEGSIADEIEKLILSGKTMSETREILHCGNDLVREVVKERNLVLPERKRRPAAISGEPCERIINYYKNEKRSQQWIANKMGCTLTAVRGVLVRAGLAA